MGYVVTFRRIKHQALYCIGHEHFMYVPYTLVMAGNATRRCRHVCSSSYNDFFLECDRDGINFHLNPNKNVHVHVHSYLINPTLSNYGTVSCKIVDATI